MKLLAFMSAIMVLTANFILSQETSKTIRDIDGNEYSTITIGNQIWMGENLKTIRYNDGTPIEYPDTANILWHNNIDGAYAWYFNDISFKDAYGALYNFYAVNNKRNICPEGWRVPAARDWQEMIRATGGQEIAGGKIKETGTENWTGIYERRHIEGCTRERKNCCAPLNPNPTNIGACNTSNFSAVPSGDRGSYGGFTGLNMYAAWWSATENDERRAIVYSVGYDRTNIARTFSDKTFGFSVRCIKE